MADPRSPDSFDIKFLVGPEAHVVDANKFVLGMNSTVFHRMFFTGFPSENEIAVPDVEPDVFQAMVNGIYGQEIHLDAENVADVYYVAEKYDLGLLRQMCKAFVLNSVNSTNALAFLNMFQHYNESEIEEKCLLFILEDPLEYFSLPDFLGASADVVRSIFKPSYINCTLSNMLHALATWMTNQELVYSETQLFEAIECHLQISRNQLETKKMRQNLFRMIEYSTTDKNVLKTSFNLDDPVYLYGVGLVLGVVPQEPIEIQISTGRKKYSFKYTVAKEGHGDVPSIQDAFFGKIPIFEVRVQLAIVFMKKETKRVCVQYNKQDSFVSYLILSKMPQM